jgi:hypothetical protein
MNSNYIHKILKSSTSSYSNSKERETGPINLTSENSPMNSNNIKGKILHVNMLKAKSSFGSGGINETINHNNNMNGGVNNSRDTNITNYSPFKMKTANSYTNNMHLNNSTCELNVTRDPIMSTYSPNNKSNSNMFGGQKILNNLTLTTTNRSNSSRGVRKSNNFN